MVLVPDLPLCPEGEMGREGFCFGSQRSLSRTVQPVTAGGRLQ